MNASSVIGFGCGLPCVAVRVVTHETPGLPQQWRTVIRQEGESEVALAVRAMEVGATLARAGHAPGWFRLENVTCVTQLRHVDEWHNTRFACHRDLHDPATPPLRRVAAAQRLLALHGDEVQQPVRAGWVH